jgi:hypothetical protein
MPITYSIEPYEITNLTWPMWDACSIECPAMIGADCPKKDDKRCPGWSAKFTDAAAEVVWHWTLESGQSEECGNATESDAWFALFKNADAGTFDGPMGAGVILCVTSQGLVQATRFTTEYERDLDWNKIIDEYVDNECENGSPTCTEADPCVLCNDEEN